MHDLERWAFRGDLDLKYPNFILLLDGLPITWWEAPAISLSPLTFPSFTESRNKRSAPECKTLSLGGEKIPDVKDKKIIVALDGNSSCGKSTYAKRIAQELGYSYIDSGAMYRAVTLAAMEAGLFDHTDAPPLEHVEQLLEGIELSLEYNPRQQRTEIYLNGRMVEDIIRRMEVSNHVSYISTISAVRKKMVEYQRQLGEGSGVVMDGRDIGTVVFPHAAMKIFLTASTNVRAMRRYKELIEKGMAAELDEVQQNLEKRDHIDSNREDSPLKQADDSIVLDNSNMTVEEQMEWFRDMYHKIMSDLNGED